MEKSLEYVGYNVNDTLLTYDVYLKMLERYETFRLKLPPENAYSPATIGKQYLKQMKIKPFMADIIGEEEVLIDIVVFC